VSGDDFVGPVKEIVTVQFESRPAGPARYTTPGSDLYELVESESDRLRVSVDGATAQFGAAAGGDLADPSTHGCGFFASLAGEEIEYTGGTSATAGVSYTLATDEIINLLIDNVQIPVTVPAATNVDVLHYVEYINEAASGQFGSAAADEVATSLLTLPVANRHPNDDYYVGWRLVLGTCTTIDDGQVATVTDYVASTGVITVDAAFTGGDTFVDTGDAYYLYNPDTMAQYKGATQFDGPVTLLTGFFDTLSFVYVGSDNAGGGTGTTGTLTTASLAGTYATVSDLATAIATEMNAVVPVGQPGLTFYVTADGDGRLTFKFGLSGDDAVGYLTFIDGATPEADLAVLAGIDTGAAVASGQMHLSQGKVARAFELTTGGFKPYDRVFLRNRILPGSTGSMNTANAIEQMGLEVQAGSGNTKLGLTTGATSEGGDKAVVHPATMVGRVGFSGGTDAVVAQPLVTFYDGTGVHTANNEFAFDIDGTPISVVFSGSATGTVTPLGPMIGLGGVQESGTAQAGAATTIQLAAGSSATDDYYNGWSVVITGGTGVGQINTVTAYVGATTTATVDTWGTNPDATSTYTITPPLLDQIITAIAATPGAPFGATAAAVLATGIVQQEGAGIRLNSQTSSVSSSVVIGEDTANSVLGFSDGEIANRTEVSAKTLASALMSNQVSTFAPFIFEYPDLDSGTWDPATGTSANYFVDLALASVAEDATGNEYLYVQSLTVGAGSTILFQNTTLGDDAMYPGTGLNIPNADGAAGESALDGFFVISNNASGTGSANDSVLNNGVGSDGVVGQTYRDAVTGLTFTILPRGFLNNEAGPWLSYPTGATATFRINVTDTFVTDANIPHNALNGLELLVANTYDVGVGDTALVETFERGGSEPAIGDLYYTTYIYRKQDYTTSFFSKMSAVENSYGTVGPDNPVSLAAYLAFLNGAVVVGIKQVPRATNSNYASLTSYTEAIEELEGPLPGAAIPDIITPLRGDSEDLYLVLRRSNNIMSSQRYRSERTSIIGMAAGSLPKDAISLAQTLGNTRMRLVYPDMATISLQDALGNTKEHLIDGPMLAAGLVGSIVSANTDVATPWTGRRLVGYSALARQLDAVEQNQVAQNGVTILEEIPPFLKVRHGLTTDMTDILTKTPTIIMIADEVQRQSRTVLEAFIGVKYLPGILSQVEGRLSMMLNSLVKKSIIAAYTGVSASVNAEDPTVADVVAYYQPIFPLLYLILTFHMRSSLT